MDAASHPVCKGLQPPILQRPVVRKRFFRIIILAALAAVLPITGCGDAKPSKSPTTTPSVSPSSTRVPTDLDLADRLYYEGDFEQAIAIYSAVAQGGDEVARQRALWTLARIQHKRGENRAAERTIKTFLKAGISAEQERLAILLLGMIEFAQGNPTEAQDALNGYVETGGPATPYAQLRLAELAARRNDYAAAIALADGARTVALPPRVESEARFAIARFQGDAGDVAGALRSYAALSVSADTSSNRAEALWHAADLAYRTGNQQSAAESLRTLVLDYPAQERALEALSHPAAGDLPAGGRALVLFIHRLNAEATQAYSALLADADTSDQADAHYHLGILAERASDYNEALAQYDAVIALFPGSSNGTLIGQALWDRATVLETVGRTDEAAQAYSSIADLAQRSEHAGQGLFRAGFLRFRQGQTQGASALWQRYATFVSDPESQARANLWLAKASGDRSVSDQHLTAAASLEPLDYYGLRARALLDGDATAPAQGDLHAATPDWAAIEQWLVGRDGPEGTARFDSSQWARGVELLHAGLEDEAGWEFEQLIEGANGQPWLLYRLTRALRDEGRASLAARAAARLVASHTDPPPVALALAYPLEYLDLAKKEAKQNGFSVLLLLGLVRQESFYDPGAVSPASAAGLTQVIPTTAGDIAMELGETGFNNRDLFRPNVSLRFGAHYLESQLKLFEGHISAALAAYNGGPGNAGRWQETSGGDPDVFLETIDLTETRAYVKLVLENYAAYQYAYGVARTPSLPLP